MTEYVSDPPPGGAGPSRYPRASPWVGWIGFAGVLMVILGAVHAFQGLVGIFKDEYFLVSSNGLALKRTGSPAGSPVSASAAATASCASASLPRRCVFRAIATTLAGLPIHPDALVRLLT